RRGLVEKPRREPKPSRREGYIPAHVRRAVWKRDGGRCQFPLEDGGVCGSTHQLEFDHIEPIGMGGLSTVENVRVACRPHNVRAAREVYGDALMDRYTSRGAKRVRDTHSLSPP
ncbi:MAG TPA: HNH endonuclease signature motif containing protein, partial [Thermoanaerobaculia bacterium]|nr:HNH endonuclease signature motif containing protein [Thermoanaerobaculia bacterium]